MERQIWDDRIFPIFLLLISDIYIMNRKDFFKTGGRLLLLGGITASAGYLLINKKVTASCSVSSICDYCGKFSDCELPQAKEAKNEKK